ncbi:MAG: hypothetical protein AB8B85_17115 [Paracoccaceae bacterium]
MRILLASVAIGCLSGCLSTEIEQSPQKQAVADEVHATIMSSFDFPSDVSSGHSATAACIAWENGNVVNISGVQGYFIDARYAVGSNPMNHLRYTALGDCAAKKKASPPCDCRIIDENGSNRIAVP